MALVKMDVPSLRIDGVGFDKVSASHARQARPERSRSVVLLGRLALERQLHNVTPL
jgi:hypothetical protein